MNSNQIWALVQSLCMIGGGYLVTLPNPTLQVVGGVLATVGMGTNHYTAGPSTPALGR